MQVSLGLPTHRVDLGGELTGARAIAELSLAAEDSGFEAVFVTDHPFPGDDWLATGGHHTLDPFIALAFAAAATTTLRLQTNLIVLAYRNPFLAAKSVATLDDLSGGRLIVGVGAGYLEPEFRALGADYAERNALTDEAIEAMSAAWTGRSVTMTGRHFQVPGNTMLPVPAQRPRPPLLIGGNSRLAMRRAASLADGWVPMPTSARVAPRLSTAAIPDTASLAARVTEAQALAAAAGRPPLRIAFTPPSLLMTAPGGALPPAQALVEEAGELGRAGVHQLTVTLPGESRAQLRAAIEAYAADVLPHLAAI